MNIALLADAGWIILAHVVAALTALVFGIWQFAGPKGTNAHRIRGRVWVMAMLLAALTSFFIHDIRQVGPFSWIHLLSLAVLFGLWNGVREARRGDIEEHRKTMTLVFAGALLVAGAFSLSPGRLMHTVILGG